MYNIFNGHHGNAMSARVSSVEMPKRKWNSTTTRMLLYRARSFFVHATRLDARRGKRLGPLFFVFRYVVLSRLSGGGGVYAECARDGVPEEKFNRTRTRRRSRRKRRPRRVGTGARTQRFIMSACRAPTTPVLR